MSHNDHGFWYAPLALASIISGYDQHITAANYKQYGQLELTS